MAKDAKGHGSEKRGSSAAPKKMTAAEMRRYDQMAENRRNFEAQMKANKAAAKKGNPVNTKEKLFSNSKGAKRDMKKVMTPDGAFKVGPRKKGKK